MEQQHLHSGVFVQGLSTVVDYRTCRYRSGYGYSNTDPPVWLGVVIYDSFRDSRPVVLRYTPDGKARRIV